MSERRRWSLVLALLTLAVALRLWAVPHARFTGDESDYWFKSRQVAVGAYRPAYGPEITGSAARLPGPAYYYLMAGPQALGASPYWGSGFVALLHGLLAFLLFRLATLAHGPRAGLVALALVAFAPWDVLYGDRIWGSCVVPVWGCLALYAAARCRERPAWMGALVFLALVLPQLHLSVPVLWAACAVVLALRPPPRWPIKAIVIGLALTGLAYLPPLVAELSSRFANTSRILAHSGGAAPWSEAVWSPVKVFGYAVLYGSSEIGYHAARGYWGGGFSEAEAYFTAAGLGRWIDRHGWLLAAGHVASVLLALIGWVAGVGRAAAGIAKARAERARPDLATTLTLGLLAGLSVGALLLMLARKTYFPHYANILMPVLLAPIAFGLDGLMQKGLRRPVAGVLVVSMAAMLVSTVRYYRTVDSLNGLGPTLSMVDRVLDEPMQVQLRFTHFHNAYAWQRLAEGVRGRPLPLSGGAAVIYTVHNRAPHRGALPAGGTRHGPTLLVRRPPEGQPAPPVQVDWRAISVTAQLPDGGTRRCRAAAGRCAYGPQPWQKLEPTMMTVGGRARPLLFMHPIQGGVVRARIPVPAGKTGGALSYALSDDATRSTNRSPVHLRLTDAAGRPVAQAAAGNAPGLKRLTFTATGAVTLEIRTDDDGARVFGFDVTWSTQPR